MAPNARLEDPCFEVYVLPPRSSNAGYLVDLVAGLLCKTALTKASLVKGSRIHAVSSEEVWVEADGELVTKLPASFEILPGGLSVVVP
jgi:diacylglycerol kinase family enzyme